MADASGMHELSKDFPALRMHRVGDGLPALHLCVGEQAGDARIPQAVGRRARALGDDQAGRSALGVVFGHQGVGEVANGAVARHRRHHDAVLQLMARNRCP